MKINFYKKTLASIIAIFTLLTIMSSISSRALTKKKTHTKTHTLDIASAGLLKEGTMSPKTFKNCIARINERKTFKGTEKEIQEQVKKFEEDFKKKVEELKEKIPECKSIGLNENAMKDLEKFGDEDNTYLLDGAYSNRDGNDQKVNDRAIYGISSANGQNGESRHIINSRAKSIIDKLQDSEGGYAGDFPIAMKNKLPVSMSQRVQAASKKKRRKHRKH